MTVLLGCIADDFTGGTDLAGMLTVQLIGVPQGAPPDDVDAAVIALKSRTNAPEETVAESLAALRWLQQAGSRQFYFKYCSTFDSTARGNIGPVAEALMQALDTDFTIACAAFPANGRTIYKGNLFVGDVPLRSPACATPVDAHDGLEPGARAAAAGAGARGPGRFFRGGEGHRRHRPALC